MKEVVIQLFAAFLGCVGFALLFNLRGKRIFEASVGGTLGWGIYLVCTMIGLGIFMSSLLAAAFCQIFSEIMARIRKMPRTVFCIPAVVPLIPGSLLYYTMVAAASGNMNEVGEYGIKTLKFALGIAAGISFVSAISIIVKKTATQMKKTNR